MVVGKDLILGAGGDLILGASGGARSEVEGEAVGFESVMLRQEEEEAFFVHIYFLIFRLILKRWCKM
ncbi:hypothetical protein SESBI_37463 [Sesbania bispinosa]|nr:hypothetical protein SESBI_37463 [Sesbania bispinosa]